MHPPIFLMKPTEMDADLSKITEPDQLSRRLSYWETRFGLVRNKTPEFIDEVAKVATKHAARVAKVLGAG